MLFEDILSMADPLFSGLTIQRTKSLFDYSVWDIQLAISEENTEKIFQKVATFSLAK